MQNHKTNSSSFDLLDERIQKFIWAEGWDALRDVQELSIPIILNGDIDVVIAASTSSGKTEAAFFPALTKLLKAPEESLIVYVSPLKALINDQFARLELLCNRLQVSVHAWHGDVGSSKKQKFTNSPHGVLLITPESLEAILCNKGHSSSLIFSRLTFFIIDELHAFIGSERGKQLQSLLHRIDIKLKKFTPRIGLSATLGDMKGAANFLRPNLDLKVSIVESKSSDANLKLTVRGYIFRNPQFNDIGKITNAETIDVFDEVARYLFNSLRGNNNLVFPNSRREVERFTFLLNKMCQDLNVPNEFWPHHGNLSKEIRLETESALKEGHLPATAICTNTLELGIDIGHVKSIAQIGPPPTVSSLRQRLGRSGRRKGEPSILRAITVESELSSKSSIEEELRLDTIQMIAMINLLIRKWYEPPRLSALHLSTLVQQILSIVAEYNGATIGQLFSTLCNSGAPFEAVDKDSFINLIRELGLKKLLTQDSNGSLLHGDIGEKLVNHYSFYTAFATEEEYRLFNDGKQLGTLPINQMIAIGQKILFAGRTWVIDDIIETSKTIYLLASKGGNPPKLGGGNGNIHTIVRGEMRQILESNQNINFIDQVTQSLILEAREHYTMRGLRESSFIDIGSAILIFTWLGDSANEALVCLLAYSGVEAYFSGPFLEVPKHQLKGRNIGLVLNELKKIQTSDVNTLLEKNHNLFRNKWDWALPVELLRLNYASTFLDFDEAIDWIHENVKS